MMDTKRIRESANEFLSYGWDEVGIDPRYVIKMCDHIDDLQRQLTQRIAQERADAMEWVLAQATNDENEGQMWRNKIVMPEIDRLRHQANEGNNP